MHLSLRTALTAVLVTLLASTGVATTASAATAPGRVPLVEVVRASPSTLTLRWKAASGAARYQVHVKTGSTDAPRRLATTVTGTTAKVGGLSRGRMYCFQVQAVSASGTKGRFSRTTCKPTIASQGTTSGAEYKVMTYNLCSKPCGSWTTRRPNAVRSVRAVMPDVLGVQELHNPSGFASRLPDVYRTAQYKSNKWLIFRTDRFALKDRGVVNLGTDRGQTRWAVWARLADRKHGGRIVYFVNAHLSPGGDTATIDGYRRANVKRLLAAIARENPAGHPVVHLGDYNSFRHRTYDSPSAVFASAGYTDAYDLARALGHPNWNSFNALQRTPRISYTFGDHVDHVWVQGRRTRVLSWRNAALMDGGRYAAPMASDHNPVVVRLLVN